MCPFTEGKALHMSQLFSLEMAVGQHDEVESLVGYTRENGGEKNKQRMLCWLEKFAKCSGKMVSGHFSIRKFFN